MTTLFAETWRSFRALPTWVQLWASWLVVLNVVVSLRDDAVGRLARVPTVVFLAVNTGLVVAERGFSKALSLAHLVVWPHLVVASARRALDPSVEPGERVAAGVLAATNAVSLGFDVPDALAWWRGDRAVAGVTPLDAT